MSCRLYRYLSVCGFSQALPPEFGDTIPEGITDVFAKRLPIPYDQNTHGNDDLVYFMKTENSLYFVYPCRRAVLDAKGDSHTLADTVSYAFYSDALSFLQSPADHPDYGDPDGIRKIALLFAERGLYPCLVNFTLPDDIDTRDAAVYLYPSTEALINHYLDTVLSSIAHLHWYLDLKGTLPVETLAAFIQAIYDSEPLLKKGDSE
ncbi:MAG: hypothetical protein IJW46_01340 [Clostridia bacterium]|nr:hypothetical protein [Clostridia bacterium]